MNEVYIAYGFKIDYNKATRALHDHPELNNYIIFTTGTNIYNSYYIFGIKLYNINKGTSSEINLFDISEKITTEIFNSMRQVAELIKIDNPIARFYIVNEGDNKE